MSLHQIDHDVSWSALIDHDLTEMFSVYGVDSEQKSPLISYRSPGILHQKVTNQAPQIPP